VPTTKQRREAARRRLERQLQRRQEKEVRRKRMVMIGSIAGGVAVVAAVVVAVSLWPSSGSHNSAASSGSPTPTPSTPAASATPTPTPTPSKSYPAAKGPSVRFAGVTVSGARDLAGRPGVTSKSTTAPAKLEYKDLVVGKGKPAVSGDSVTVQYVGALYKNGKVFDASWAHGSPATFTVDPSSVIKGFDYGIAGTSGVPPMKVGGRRIIIMPASLGYGANSPSGSGIPANSPLVFVVDLTKVAAG
jgi:hypothetical protein